MDIKIFVIDEDIAVREALYEILTGEGTTVITFPRGIELLERLKSERGQMVFLEDTPGEFSGVLLAQKIREVDNKVALVLMGPAPKTEAQLPPLKDLCVCAYINKDFIHPATLKTIRASVAAQRTASLQPSPKRGCRVLIVDDEMDSRAMLSSFLKRHGFETEAVASGEECLDRLKNVGFDMVLLDISMSGMDGLLTLKRIKALDAAIKVVMVSALQNKEVLMEARGMGADDYLVKPFNLEAIVAKIKEIL
ncbi:MAG: response regulator [Candidatus Omnitrophota bacterium]